MEGSRRSKIIRITLAAIVIGIAAFIAYYNVATNIDPPTDIDPLAYGPRLEVMDGGLLACGASRLSLNDFGLWEMYLSGGPLELGTAHGRLAAELVKSQEDAFVKQIKTMIPSESYLKFLKYFIAWFNKDLDEYILPEYLMEIYGVSAYASDDYGFIGPKYNRILNYHAAHDIGHALQNMNLVECTAFGLWDDRSDDGSLLIGRNFDFYVGDDFAKNKIIAFVDPDAGHAFASITWAGMIGVVSGMNEKGLCITLNSAKSDIPFGARTPVSIIAREILQYASNIEEALAIAQNRKSFVSESFLIGSAEDHKVVVIEKSPEKTAVYDPGTDHIILTNHFQSAALIHDPLNVENMENETSVYRYLRVQELLEGRDTLGYLDVADILRDRRGLGGMNIGLGNEKAINQLIAHHSVIFKPEERKLWISAGRFQQGSYLCYDLDSIFGRNSAQNQSKTNYLEACEIPPDQFFGIDSLAQYDLYREFVNTIKQAIKDNDILVDERMIPLAMIDRNPDFYYSYALLGEYFMQRGNTGLAVKYFTLALSMEVSSGDERRKISNWLNECLEEK